MPFLTPEVQEQVRTTLEGIQNPVKILLFTQKENAPVPCEFCKEAQQLVEEVAALSDRVSLDVYDFVADSATAERYNVDKIPALVIVQDSQKTVDYGVRLYGIPSGYEFGTLVEDLLLVSQGDAELSSDTMGILGRLKSPVHIQVYVTPTCPYCPQAVLLAHRMAIASEFVTADLVEATEFPQLANRYRVYGVPRTVINDVIHVEGAVPEGALASRLLEVMDEEKMASMRSQWIAGQN